MIPNVAGNLVAGAGQAPSQDLSALLTALMGGGSLGSMQQGQTVNVQSAPPSTERALLDALTRGRDMQEMGHGYNPRATWGNVLTAIASPIAGRKKEKKADEELRELRRLEGEAAKQAKADERAAKREDYEWRKKIDQQYAAPAKEADPLAKERARFEELIARGVSEQDALYHSGIGSRPNSGVTVNTGNQGPQYGSIPQGYMVQDGRMLPVPGGPADMEQRAAAEAETKAAEGRVAKGVNVVDEIDHAMSLLGSGTSGIGGAIMQHVPGSQKVDFEAAMNTVLGNVGFDRLQRMREESPTGGALGQVSERELALLTSTVAGYDPNMSEEGKRRTLEKIRKHYGNFTQALNGEMPDDYAEGGGDLEARAKAAIEAGADPQAVMQRLRELQDSE